MSIRSQTFIRVLIIYYKLLFIYSILAIANRETIGFVAGILKGLDRNKILVLVILSSFLKGKNFNLEIIKPNSLANT